jgi:hypothetical protein
MSKIVDPNFCTTHPRIANGHRMMPHFKDCIGALDGTHIVATPAPRIANFCTTHPRIANGHRMMPHFKDCIGALDGTHIVATPAPQDLIRYIGRSGKATQNVLAIVDFDTVVHLCIYWTAGVYP